MAGLINDNDMTIKDFADCYKFKYSVENLKEKKIDKNVLGKIEPHHAQLYRILPAELSADGKILTIYTDNPRTLNIREELRLSTKADNIEIIFVESQNLSDAITHHYELTEMMDHNELLANLNMPMEEDVADENEEDQRLESERLRQEAADGTVVGLVNLIIWDGVMRRASDIHIEPRERGGMQIRYRIDGELYPHQKLHIPDSVKLAVISRIKIMAELNIAEKREAQDGRIRLLIAGKRVDFRVNIMPTILGEEVVMRILDKAHVLLNLETLGIDPVTLKRYRKLKDRPYGMILVTGPTGTGKTTTLYATLSEYNNTSQKIKTIEDPVEYQLPGISQTQVKHAKGSSTKSLSFADGLRSFLRQDPDIIMVGEIRDKETAVTAVSAALTGHMLLSTIHTKDAASTVSRLIQLGVEDYLVMDALLAIVAQRLPRRNCPDCAVAYTPDLSDLSKEDRKTLEGTTFMHSVGCEKCQHLKFRGRVGIYELLEMNDEIRDLFLTTKSLPQIKRALKSFGFKTMWDNGLERVKAGELSLEELSRVII